MLEIQLLVPDGVVSSLTTVSSWFIIFLLCLWIVATILKIHEPTEDKMSKSLGPVIRFVPNYNFFAPIPGHLDYYLLYRDQLANGEVTQWDQVSELNDLPTRSHWLWNPNLYNAKTLFDYADFIVSDFSPSADESSESTEDALDEHTVPDDTSIVLGEIENDNFQLSIYYIQLLNYVTSRERHADCEKTQFLIMAGSLRQNEQPFPKILSNYHEVE